MKWVALATLVSISAYTAVTLHYRRPGPAYQPYQDNKQRVIVSRLRSAGYQRITATVDRPASPDRAANPLAGPLAEIADETGGVPEELNQLFVDQPRPPPSFNQVQAPREANQLFPYSLGFTCELPSQKQLLSGTYVYVKEQEIAIIPDFEAIGGNLLTRTPESAVQLTIPAGLLHPGSYQVRLVGQEHSKRWALQVH
jgi:hypothetical protein